MLRDIWLQTDKHMSTDSHFQLLVASGLLHLVEPFLAGTQYHWSDRTENVEDGHDLNFPLHGVLMDLNKPAPCRNVVKKAAPAPERQAAPAAEGMKDERQKGVKRPREQEKNADSSPEAGNKEPKATNKSGVREALRYLVAQSQAHSEKTQKLLELLQLGRQRQSTCSTSGRGTCSSCSSGNCDMFCPYELCGTCCLRWGGCGKGSHNTW